MDDPDTKYAVEATRTSFTLLETLADADESRGITDLSEATGLSKSVVHNHLSTLRAMGYVVKRGRKYTASLRTLDVGDRIREHSPLYRCARSHVDGLASASGEIASLFILEEQSGVPAHIGHGSDVTPPYRLGERMPLHVNPPGKAILSALPQEESEALLDAEPLEAPTENTTTDPDALRRELRRVRDDGVVFCREEQFEGYVGVAAPIDAESAPSPAALSVVGPKERLSGRYLEEDITGQVVRTARAIQVELTEQLDTE